MMSREQLHEWLYLKYAHHALVALLQAGNPKQLELCLCLAELVGRLHELEAVAGSPISARSNSAAA